MTTKKTTHSEMAAHPEAAAPAGPPPRPAHLSFDDVKDPDLAVRLKARKDELLAIATRRELENALRFYNGTGGGFEGDALAYATPDEIEAALATRE
jgi:hypothetical protein